MFHTFKTAQYVNAEQARSGDTHSGRRPLISRACDRCRQRKRRCNGGQPCENCVWYHTAAPCHYSEPRERAASAKSSHMKTAGTLRCYRSILQDVFPSVHPDDLHKLSSEERSQLLHRTTNQPLSSTNTPPDDINSPSTCREAEDLDTLQPVPDENNTLNNNGCDTPNISQNPSAIRNINQDVNVLPLSMKNPTTCLGISMPPAVLRVIRWLYPDCVDVFAELQTKNALTRPDPGVLLSPCDGPEQDFAEIDGSSAWDEIPLINSYFTYFHPSQPLIDERSFRATYMSQKRKDARWNLLLNVVLALGSIAANTAEDISHTVYYDRAKQWLKMELLTVHWETVQALGLLGGVYLHHIQQPDEGIAMVGAAMRLALALGLHRDCSARLAAVPQQDMEHVDGTVPGAIHLTMEMRSRIWWTLFNVDTWGCNGLGRPSMGRLSNAVTTRIPTEPIGNSAAMTRLFQDAVRYCMVSTRIEDAMALSPLIDDADRKELDNALTDWYRASSVQNGEATESVRITPGKNLLRWRYGLSQITLHRPLLLLYAVHKTKFSSLRPEHRTSIEICRKAAEELITDIATTWQAPKACQFSGTHATWILYQATMVPLLSLFSDYTDSRLMSECRRQVEIAMSALMDLCPWSIIGRQSLESVSLLYEASQRYSEQQRTRVDQSLAETQRPGTSDQHGSDSEYFRSVDHFNGEEYNNLHMSGHKELIDSNIPDDLDWYTKWDSMDYTLDVQYSEWRHSNV